MNIIKTTQIDKKYIHYQELSSNIALQRPIEKQEKVIKQKVAKMQDQNDMFAGAFPKEIGQNDLAEITGYTVRRLQQLKAEGIPLCGKGRYKVNEVFKWFIDRHGKGKAQNSNRERLLIAQADAAEIKNQQSMKELLPVDVIGNALNQMGVIIASQLEAMPPRLANELTNQSDPDYVKQIIEDETRQMRVAIAGLFNNIEFDQDNSINNTAATNKDSKPMG